MEDALVARLVGAAGIAAIVGARVSWFGRNRDETLPALQLSKIAPGRDWDHDGPTGLDRPAVQFDCWAASSAQAHSLSLALRNEMEAAADQSGVRFHPAQLDRERWGEEANPDGVVRLFRVSMDFSFFCEEI